MVSCQLFPFGQHGPSVCLENWSEPCNSLDVRLAFIQAIFIFSSFPRQGVCELENQSLCSFRFCSATQLHDPHSAPRLRILKYAHSFILTMVHYHHPQRPCVVCASFFGSVQAPCKDTPRAGLPVMIPYDYQALPCLP